MDSPSQPRLRFRRSRTARGVIALHLEDKRDAAYGTNGGAILWRAEGVRSVITASGPCLVSSVVPPGQVTGRDGDHCALPAQSDERGSASPWTLSCNRMTAVPCPRCTNKIVSSRLRLQLRDSDSRFRFALCKWGAMPKSGDLLYNCKSKFLKTLRSWISKQDKRFQVRLVRSTSGVQSHTIRFPGKSGLFGLPKVPEPTAFWDRARSM